MTERPTQTSTLGNKVQNISAKLKALIIEKNKD